MADCGPGGAYLGWAIRSTRERDNGMGMGACQTRSGRRSWVRETWDDPMARARRPWGESRLAAMGRIRWKRSTARMVTNSAPRAVPEGPGEAPKDSARPGNTLMLVNLFFRITSLRNVAFMLCGSISTT